MLLSNAPAGCDTDQATEYFNIIRTRALKSLKLEEKRQERDLKRNEDEVQRLKADEGKGEAMEKQNTGTRYYLLYR